MNATPLITRALFAATVALAGSAALADDVTTAPEVDRAGTIARAAVQAEVLQARQARTLAPAGEAGAMDATMPRTALSREDVRADQRKAASRTVGELYLPA